MPQEIELPVKEGKKDLFESKEDSTYRKYGFFWRSVVVLWTIAGLFLAINQIFTFGLLGRVEFENAYMYALFACFLSLVFILFPAGKGARKEGVPWYDALLFLVTVVVCFYLCSLGYDISQRNWDYNPPLAVWVLALLLCLITLEALRRACGMGMFVTSAIFALYPTVASFGPGFLEGVQLPLDKTIAFHALGRGSILGVATDAFGSILVGFMLFGAALVATGGGRFFIDFAFSLFGTKRGGPAKAAVVASAFFGSISGSAIANVVTVGTVTIPAMKRAGYEPYFAGAVEATASNGGPITPPIMGSVAFLMAAWLSVPYYKIMVAAAVPAFLYYLVLFLQVDAYAAIKNLKGLPKSEIPPMKQVLKRGWPFIFGFVSLLYIVYLGLEAQAPFIATIVLIVVGFISRSFHFKNIFGLLEETGKLLCMICAIMAGVGFIVGSCDVTGIGPAFSSEMIMFAGNSVFLLLVLGALANIILGTGLSITACYVFLAIVLAPALTRVGLNPMAVHLFIIFWAVAGNLTPPVAFPAYTASVIAGSGANKTAFQAMKLGIVAYIIPFFFVTRPELILQGPISGMAGPLFSVLLGSVLMAGGLAGYLWFIGQIPMVARISAFAAGLLLAIPGWKTDLAGFFLFMVIAGFLFFYRRSRRNVTGDRE